jgi:nicotinate-nucleotide pyrophosphorylase (carboxylating)
VERVLAAALAEDLGEAGDRTTVCLVPAGATAEGVLLAEQELVAAGASIAAAVFRRLSSGVEVLSQAEDGSRLSAGDALLRVRGAARALLTGERTALNLLGRLGGIATLTRRVVDSLAGTATRVYDTRKTTPGLRRLEKYAVRCGGGENHRSGLYDMALIKENHIAVVGGAAEAVRRARQALPAGLPLQVEVTTLAELEAAMEAGADLILLDNMDRATMAEAVRRSRGRAVLEASGGIHPDTASDIARATGVDRISLGALTRSAPWVEVSMDLALDAHDG